MTFSHVIPITSIPTLLCITGHYGKRLLAAGIPDDDDHDGLLCHERFVVLQEAQAIAEIADRTAFVCRAESCTLIHGVAAALVGWGAWPTQNFGWVGHNTFGPTNKWF